VASIGRRTGPGPTRRTLVVTHREVGPHWWVPINSLAGAIGEFAGPREDRWQQACDHLAAM